MLSACVGSSADEPLAGDSETVTYRGESLHCNEPGTGETSSLTCDFETFYVRHPELLKDRSTASEDEVAWLSEQGYSLPCVSHGMGKTRRMACDWQRFYILHPDIAPGPR